jgi:hypothetical protein
MNNYRGELMTMNEHKTIATAIVSTSTKWRGRGLVLTRLAAGLAGERTTLGLGHAELIGDGDAGTGDPPAWMG